MITKIKKTGNSRSIVLPPAVWDLLKITEDTLLEVSTDGVSIKIYPVNEADQAVEKAGEEVFAEHFKTFKALADR